MNFNLEQMEAAGGATDKTHVTSENPSKRLDHSPVGDSIESDPALRTLSERIAFNEGHHMGFVAGQRIGRSKRNGQKLELRRLNKVIQQMSWKLHRKMHPLRRFEWAELVIGIVLGVIVGFVVGMIVVLWFS